MKEQKTVSTKLPSSVYEDIVEKVNSSKYMTVSDFVRQAIREKLEENG